MDQLKKEPKRTARRKRWTINDLLGKFQKFVLMSDNGSVIDIRRKLRFYSGPLENFLETFSKLRWPEQFDRVHVEDYRIDLQRKGYSDGTIERDVRVIKQFWAWIIRTELAPITDNIALGFPHATPDPNKKSRLSLADLNRLRRELYDPRLRRAVNLIMSGMKVGAASERCDIAYSTAQRLFAAAAKRAGLKGIGLARLRRYNKEASKEALVHFMLGGGEFDTPHASASPSEAQLHDPTKLRTAFASGSQAGSECELSAGA